MLASCSLWWCCEMQSSRTIDYGSTYTSSNRYSHKNSYQPQPNDWYMFNCPNRNSIPYDWPRQNKIIEFELTNNLVLVIKGTGHIDHEWKFIVNDIKNNTWNTWQIAALFKRYRQRLYLSTPAHQMHVTDTTKPMHFRVVICKSIFMQITLAKTSPIFY